MIFRYDQSILSKFPSLSALAFIVTGISPKSRSADAHHQLLEWGRLRLAQTNEGGMPEIQAWRRTFSEMGLKPTQYRCAAEALLRRLRTEGDLPRLHPLVDLCNAASAAYAIPVAIFDMTRIGGTLEVRPAVGNEVFETFSGHSESPEPGEIVFSDADGRAHARRWTHRQVDIPQSIRTLARSLLWPKRCTLERRAIFPIFAILCARVLPKPGREQSSRSSPHNDR